ncbi:MAG: hypothetical protein V1837_01655 [Candidatus Woesearchaeota archaeon]
MVEYFAFKYIKEPHPQLEALVDGAANGWQQRKLPHLPKEERSGVVYDIGRIYRTRSGEITYYVGWFLGYFGFSSQTKAVSQRLRNLLDK